MSAGDIVIRHLVIAFDRQTAAHVFVPFVLEPFEILVRISLRRLVPGSSGASYAYEGLHEGIVNRPLQSCCLLRGAQSIGKQFLSQSGIPVPLPTFEIYVLDARPV